MHEKLPRLDFTLIRPFNWIGSGLDSIHTPKEGSSRVLTQFLGNIVRGENIQLVDGGAQMRSFTYVDDGPGARRRGLEGELYLSTARITAQARRYRHSPGAELLRLVTHGLLHLTGHDHVKAGERRVMRAAERHALYERTRETLRTSCPRAQEQDVAEHCQQQAAFITRFPECNTECKNLAARFSHRPSR